MAVLDVANPQVRFGVCPVISLAVDGDQVQCIRYDVPAGFGEDSRGRRWMATT
jgi:hypothetical protein